MTSHIIASICFQDCFMKSIWGWFNAHLTLASNFKAHFVWLYRDVARVVVQCRENYKQSNI